MGFQQPEDSVLVILLGRLEELIRMMIFEKPIVAYELPEDRQLKMG